jgi:hypothetical protein
MVVGNELDGIEGLLEHIIQNPRKEIGIGVSKDYIHNGDRFFGNLQSKGNFFLPTQDQTGTDGVIYALIGNKKGQIAEKVGTEVQVSGFPEVWEDRWNSPIKDIYPNYQENDENAPPEDFFQLASEEENIKLKFKPEQEEEPEKEPEEEPIELPNEKTGGQDGQEKDSKGEKSLSSGQKIIIGILLGIIFLVGFEGE